MDTNQAKSILIRHRDNDKDPDNHQQPSKIHRPESSDDDTVQPTKIIDLIDDCWMNILSRLDLKSLLSVALVNKWTQAAAADVYKRKFGAKKVYIGKCDDYSTETRSNTSNAIDPNYLALEQLWYGDIVIGGLKSSLQFLRCFGPSIENLMINFNNSKSKRYQYVLQYMNEYCAKSLTEFSIWDMPNIAIAQQFQNVFSNVTTVRFYRCNLGQQWPSIVECFPNIQDLYLGNNVYCGANKTIEKSFQHLQNIRIDGWEKISTQKIVDNLLQMAHQLTSLEIGTNDDFDVQMDTLLNSIKYNRSISKLIVKTYIAKTPINSNEVHQLISNHPALIELVLPEYRFAVDDAIQMVQELHSLKKFCLKIKRTDYTYFVNQLADVWTTNIYQTWGSNYVVIELNR